MLHHMHLHVDRIAKSNIQSDRVNQSFDNNRNSQHIGHNQLEPISSPSIRKPRSPSLTRQFSNKCLLILPRYPTQTHKIHSQSCVTDTLSTHNQITFSKSWIGIKCSPILTHKFRNKRGMLSSTVLQSIQRIVTLVYISMCSILIIRLPRKTGIT